MNLLIFITQYPDEESCKLKLKLKSIKDKEEIVYRRCGSSDHYWKSDKWQYECKHYKSRTIMRSGTIMYGFQLLLRYWFVAIHLLASTKKSFSALELQSLLVHKYYEPIWAMLHKLRLAIGKRDSQYSLSGQIELDEEFFSIEVNQEEKKKKILPSVNYIEGKWRLNNMHVVRIWKYYFYKTDREEPARLSHSGGLDRLIETAKKQRKEENMKTNPRVNGRGTFH
jgi:hypothetical protein